MDESGKRKDVLSALIDSQLLLMFFRQSDQLARDAVHDFIGRAVHSSGLDAGVNLVIDVIHDDEFFEGQGNLGGEPIESANGCDALGDVVK